LSLSFTTAQKLFEIIEKHLPQGPHWNSTSITLPDAPDEPQEFYHQDILECTKFLFGDPSFSGDMLYSAAEYFEGAKEGYIDDCEGLNRIYCEMNSGDLWVKEERKLPKHATLHTIILASDKTHLTNYSGDKSMHVVLMTLGNIRKSVRRKIKQNAYILLAEIPSPKFECTHFSTVTEERDMPGILRRQLFHSCMSIILEPLRQYGQPALLYRALDPDGYTQKCAAILAGWIADMDELWTILGLSPGACAKCLTTHANLDSPCEQNARTSQW
ncbi:uncharacterized protein EI90DRAFT_2850290, partial [Cantharellus anzutake]|uniref:uncharacterized protein n=1 Tax=Cantharellus anzutake TaxID=1750568 RepID=UPI001903E000